MKSTRIRQDLETRILRLKNKKAALSQQDFEQFLTCLFQLYRLNRSCALRQKKISTCACGDVGDFVTEFVGYTTPLLHRISKSVELSVVRGRRTVVFFSPRLTEIALGCMMGSFLKKSDKMGLSVFYVESGVIIAANGIASPYDKADIDCLKHISALHSGKIMMTHGKDYEQLSLFLPCWSELNILKVVPDATELCRLCYFDTVLS